MENLGDRDVRLARRDGTGPALGPRRGAMERTTKRERKNVMKNIFATALALGFLALVGCGGVDPEMQPGDEQPGDEQVGTESEALTIGAGTIGGGGGLSNWCSARADCIDKCNRDYSSASTRKFCIKTFCPACPANSTVNAIR